jgi:deoxyribose-phosphate aldolase
MKLTPKDIAKMLDHSTLQPFLTQEDIRKGCELALKYDTASVCARPADMPLVKNMLEGSDVHVCTVNGFPHGNHKPEIKLAEAQAALDDGCDELDMVINIGRLLAGDEQYVQDEIASVCALAHSRNAKVKVIIETCYLNDEQKARVCKLAAAAGADWVKTSTGYGTAGCKLSDVVLMRRSVPADCQVKGSGGIRDLDTVLALRVVGATRCGVSATEKIMQEAEARFTAGDLTEPSLDELSFEEGDNY